MLESVNSGATDTDPQPGKNTRVGLVVDVTEGYFTARLDSLKDTLAAEGGSEKSKVFGQAGGL